jgi:tetratricopeptide (TPR) repeat protein
MSEQAAASQPQKFGYLKALANAYDRLGSAMSRVDESQTLEWKEKALDVRERIARLDPQGRSTVRDLVVSYLGLADTHTDQDVIKKYLDLARERADYWWSIDRTDYEATRMLARLELRCSEWFNSRGESELALQHALRGVELYRGQLEQSSNAASRRSLFVALNTLGDLYLDELDDLAAADPILKEQVEIADFMIQAGEDAEQVAGWRDEIIEKQKRYGLR